MVFIFKHTRSMLMTACDLGAVTRPWEISKQVRQTLKKKKHP